MARVLSPGPAAASEASARCPLLSRPGLAGTVRRSRRKKRRWWRPRRRPGPGAGRWALWLPCIRARVRDRGTLPLLLGPRQDRPPRRKRMGCWLEGPGLKGAGAPPARIVPSAENLSAQHITSKCICECTQASGPTSVRTVTTRAPSPARSSITYSATTGSRGAGLAPGHPRNHRLLPSGVQPRNLEPSRLHSLRPGWRVPQAPGLLLAVLGRGPVGSPPALGGPCATGEVVRPNPWTCPCGQGREARPGRGVPSTAASSALSPLEPQSSWPCTFKCTTAAGLGAAGHPRLTRPRPLPEYHQERPLPVLRRKGRRAPGCPDPERQG